ncbi:MAG: NifB/NifX family molybdenum-iron cluster-binding protein [Candidatus Omnitrophica bacterium]|nr:NifB/NifX family molybdenum-iron cluster-binding protein [Candidatus Omnitrophota bacterium]
MKICIPSKSNDGYGAKIYDHFGSSPFLAIHNHKDQSLFFIDNHAHHHIHGTCQAIGQIKPLGIKVVLCSGMGVRAVGQLNQNGIKAFCTDGDISTVREAIDQYYLNSMEEVIYDNACLDHFRL